jgi:hypothetical protein
VVDVLPDIVDSVEDDGAVVIATLPPAEIAPPPVTGCKSALFETGFMDLFEFRAESETLTLPAAEIAPPSFPAVLSSKLELVVTMTSPPDEMAPPFPVVAVFIPKEV